MAVVFSDTFTDTDGVKLGSHTPTVGVSYTVLDYTLIGGHTAEINTNQLRAVFPGYNAFYRWKLNPTSAFTADHVIGFNFGANIGLNGNASLRMQTRYQSDTSRYEFRLTYNNNTSYALVTATIAYVNSVGTVTTLTTGTFSPTAFAMEPIVCTVEGSLLSMTRNGTALLSISDSTITAAGDMNLRINVNDFTDPFRIDNLVIDNAASGPTATATPAFGRYGVRGPVR